MLICLFSYSAIKIARIEYLCVMHLAKLLGCYQYFYQGEAMSDQQQFQSAQKQCSLEIVAVNHFPGQSSTPRKKVYENNIAWKFEKIKRVAPTVRSPQKPDTKNISFQTDYLDELSEQQKDAQTEDCASYLTQKYKKCDRVYKKERAIGSSWLGHCQYFASIFIDPAKLAKSDKSIFQNRKNAVDQLPQPFTFSSEFESGNLFSVFRVGNNQFDLVLQNDINSKGNTQWFYFQIANIPAKTKIKLNIVNMLKSDSLFNYGMQPCLHSLEAEKRNGQGWFRSGTGIKYFRNENRVDGSHRFYYTLTFTVMTPYDHDTLRIAQSYPYTIQNLNTFLENVQKRPGRKSYFKRQAIGQTLGKNNIEYIKIAQDNPRKKGPRPLIIITARQHPGQTPSSFACQGFMDFIASDEKQASYLRKNYEIYVLPMLNPDGVMVGNYRTNLCGVDLNRRWDGSKSQQALQTVLVKKFLFDISRNRQVAFMIDLHGHSRKLFSFFYGNMSEQNPIEVRLFPYICSKSSEGLIRFEDSTFACQQEKKKTARVQMASKFKIPNVFTFQISFFGFINKNKQRIHYTQQKIRSLGVILGKSMFLYERYRSNSQNVEATIVKKYYQQLSGKPELIKCGQKVGSGSETQPEKGQINQNELLKIQQQKNQTQSPDKNKKNSSKSAKKDTIKQILKNSRQLHVMDIARVNSIFPNDVLALMPSSFTKKVKQKQKIKRDRNSVMVQTQQVPVIKIYDMCRVQQLRQDKELSLRKKIGIKNESENALTSRSNLFRTVVRPKSSSNSYLESNLQSPAVKPQTKKRHESGIEIKEKKQKIKISVHVQTTITFSPDTDFMTRTLDSLIISPVSKGLQALKRKTNFATITPEATSASISKTSTQSFKIGLRALNVETWRIKKKSFQ